jgi:5'-3' exonuclease
MRKPRPPTLRQQTETFERVWSEINKIFNIAKPRKQLVLCIDGVAPMSKQIQQRQRRFKSVNDKVPEEFDSNAITPGTKFMDYLSKFIDFKIREEMSKSDAWKDIQVIFSNEKVPGEGEHKLITYTRLYGKDDDTFCIHGLDADLIMLSLVTHREKFHILRDNHRDRREIFHINLEYIRKDLIQLLNWGDKAMHKSLIDDFVFMMFSVGNDFLPHLPAIDILDGGIEILIEAYKKNAENYGHLTHRNESNKVFFNQESFSEFLRILGMYEEDLLNKKANSRDSYFRDEILENNSKVIEGKYVVDFKKYKEEYYSTKLKTTDIKNICNSYIEGLQWVLTYYTSGVSNWTWIFPGYYTVFSSDLVDYVKKYKHITYPKTEPLSPFEQLLCVLPSFSKNLLPPSLSELVDSKNSPMKEYYPEQFVIDLDGKRNDWESIAILPIIDITQVKKYYSQKYKEISERDMRRNCTGKTYLYTPTTNYHEYKSFYGTISSNIKVTQFNL